MKERHATCKTFLASHAVSRLSAGPSKVHSVLLQGSLMAPGLLRSGLLKASLLKASVLIFAVLLIESAQAADTTEGARIARPPMAPLLGRVQQRDGVQKLGRPLTGQAGLNQSVKILGQNGSASLRGGAMDPALNATSEEDAIKKVLDANNFQLSYQKMTGQSDPGTLSSSQGSMTSVRRKPCCPQARMRTYRFYGYGYGSPWDENSWSVSAPGGGYELDNWRMQIDGVHATMPNRFGNRGFNPPSRGLSFPPIQPMDMSPLRNTPSQIQPLYVQPVFVDQNIAWDEWYKNVSDALYRNWAKINSLPGEAKLRISVSRGRKIDVQILSTNNYKPSFKTSLTNAVQCLNGSNILEFPKMSDRSSVNFDSVFTSGTTVSSGAYSERTNDVERVRKHANDQMIR